MTTNKKKKKNLKGNKSHKGNKSDMQGPRDSIMNQKLISALSLAHFAPT